MIVQKDHIIDFFEVAPNSTMTFQAMARCFQDLATTHSDQVGAGFKVLSRRSQVWFLNRLRIQAARRPVLHEKVRLSTWTRGIKRFKNFREYRIESEDGNVLVKGSAVWLFYDLAQLRIATVPQDIIDRYESENIINFEDELDHWQPCGKIIPEKSMDLPLRYSDFDVNGHVNNTEYIGFLENLVHRTAKEKAVGIKDMKIRFAREIDREKTLVQTGWCQKENAYQCNIYDRDLLFADACIESTL